MRLLTIPIVANSRTDSNSSLASVSDSFLLRGQFSSPVPGPGHFNASPYSLFVSNDEKSVLCVLAELIKCTDRRGCFLSYPGLSLICREKGVMAKVNLLFITPARVTLVPTASFPGAEIESGCKSYGDRHILVLDKDNCLLYETWSRRPDRSAAKT